MAAIAHLNRDDPRPFDVREFARTVQGSRRDSLPWEWLGAHPFDRSLLQQARYMALAERHTMHHMRNLLVTPSHKDAYVTAFLTSWAFEKYWAADALIAILEANAVPAEELRLPAGRTVGGRVAAVLDRLVPIRNSVAANIIGEDFIAVHMAWGMLEERLAQIVYEEMAARSGLLGEGFGVFDELAAQKDRHLEFYSHQAGLRLGRSAAARRLARTALTRSWLPLSFSAQPRFETARAIGPLLESPAALRKVSDLDRTMAALPGFAGRAWASEALEGLGLRVRRASRPAAGLS